jgi:Phosphatidylglycerol lysyltransferase, C-terminal
MLMRVLPRRDRLTEVVSGAWLIWLVAGATLLKLWPDKSYFLSETRRSAVAYKTALGVALSLGDPVGPDEELEGTVRAFLRFCSDNGWKVAFHQVLPDLPGLYDRLGFQAVKIGEVAVVDLGVPLERAVLASVLFRVVYYLIPFLAALGLYCQLARDAARSPARL